MSRYSRVVLAENPTLYLRFGEKTGTVARDSSGHGIDGTYQAGPTLGVPGAIAFDPDTGVTLSSQYISVGGATDPGDVFTQEYWIRPRSFSTQILSEKGAGGACVYIDSNGKVNLQKTGTALIVTSTMPVILGIWNHVVVVKSGASCAIVINGVGATGAISNQTITANANVLNFGEISGGEYFDGDFDEFAFYDHDIGNARIAIHYNAGIGAQSAIVTLLEITWASGTEYYSFMGERSPSADYDDLIESIEPVSRETALWGAGMSAASLSGRLFNRDLKFSEKLFNETSWRGISVTLKLVTKADGLSSATTIIVGKLIKASISKGLFAFEAVDSRWSDLFAANISQSIPKLIPNIFPGLSPAQSPDIVPLIYGRVQPITNAFGSFGAVAAKLVDTAGVSNGMSGNYVYALCARNTAWNSGGTQALDTFRYNNSYSGSRIMQKFSSGVYTFTLADFSVDQRDPTRPNESEITYGLDGITETDVETAPPILNAVRSLEHYLVNYIPLSLSDFDTSLQSAAKTEAVSRLYADDLVNDNYSPASLGAAIENGDLTQDQVIGMFCESFGFCLYSTKDGKLATFVLTDDNEPDATIAVDDENNILQGSLVASFNDDVASVLQFNHMFRWTFGQQGDRVPGQIFLRQPDYVIPGEKLLLDPSGSIDIRNSISQYFVRKTSAALSAARAVSECFRSKAQKIELDLPVRFFDQIELNSYCSVTAREAIGSAGGYAGAVGRIIGYTIAPGATDARIHLRLFRRAPATIGRDDFIRADSTSIGSGWTESSSLTSTFEISSNRLMAKRTGVILRAETFSNNQLASIRSRSDGVSADCGPVVRGSGTRTSFTGYQAILTQSGGIYSIKLRKYVAQALTGSGSTIGSAILGITNSALEDKVIEIRAEGTTISVYVYSSFNVVGRSGKVIEVTDASIASGAPGYASDSPQARFSDDFYSRDF